MCPPEQQTSSRCCSRPEEISFLDSQANLQALKWPPLMKELERLSRQLDASKACVRKIPPAVLDACFDLVFEFVDQPFPPLQRNYAPTEEIEEPFIITDIDGQIPDHFTEGVYIRNGPNPLFGGFKTTKSIMGQSNQLWIEGEGMLHALYLSKNSGDKRWTISYNNKYVESETFKLEKRRNKPSALPSIEGHPAAILSCYWLNLLRFGKANKDVSNTSVFELGGRCYAAAENHLPQEIDLLTLETLGEYDVNGAWNRPFTAHPKKDPVSGELIIIGVDAFKPYVELGVISADGERLVHKVDLQYKRRLICHDLGITQRYNVLLDFPLTIDVGRLVRGGPLIKYEGGEYARIGVMPRYGTSSSVRWFDVEPNITFHILNCFEDGDEVVVRGCRARQSIIPGPEMGLDKFEWFSRGFKPLKSTQGQNDGLSQDGSLFGRCYEWRLNTLTGEEFTGSRNKYGYTQVADSVASSAAGMPKFGGLAKLYLEEPDTGSEGVSSSLIKVKYHMFPENVFCTGAAFVPKPRGREEDDGWIISFVHNEAADISQVFIVDTKSFSSEPVAKLSLPRRVPYGFHGSYMPFPLQSSNLWS
uniref:Carotenoid cleavage dioxygenase n=1 Tax=Kalanchoe fedtschenkoi TaxID=63787 RepID=A0A7N0V5X9_KALFE